MNRIILFLLLISLSATTQAQEKNRNKTFAIKNVNIIPMTVDNKVIENATIVIEDNTIVSINKPVPNSAEIIDAKGKWLIPGLIDMHVHTPVDGHFNTNYPTRAAAIFTSTQDVMTPYVTNGVTTIFELNTIAGHFGQRNEILRGDVIGPRMALAALINGGEGDGRIANNPADGRQSVRMAKAEGYEFIKVYSNLNIETYKAIVDEANKQGMKVVGHIPNAFRGRLEEAFIPHWGMVAHAEEYAKQSKDYSDSDIQRFAKLAKENGTWLIPTLTIIERSTDQARSVDSVRNLEGFPYVHPLLQNKWLTSNNNFKGTSPERVERMERLSAFNKRLVKGFKEAGVPIVTGTDAGCSGVVWGFSLLDEIELLVEAGLTSEEALTSATRLPSTWLEIDNKTGTVEEGKFADLVLLDGNPLTDIHNIRKINAVVVNGHLLNRKAIDDMLSDLSNRNTAARDKYDWSKKKEY